MKRSQVGISTLYILASLTALGGFAADFNRTHLFNPAWPAHAKFHDAMTISLGLFLGLSAIYFLANRRHSPHRYLRLSVLLPAMFWASMLVSFLYPGAGGLDADFPGLVPVVAGIRINELPVSVAMLTLLADAYRLASAAPASPNRD